MEKMVVCCVGKNHLESGAMLKTAKWEMGKIRDSEKASDLPQVKPFFKLP